MKERLAIGLMSGSSLDGIDLALVRFASDGSRYGYTLLAAETLPYPEAWRQRLANAFLSQPESLKPMDHEYGAFLGDCIADFARRHHVTPDFVASHGHTIFHQPERRYTLQIGEGQAIADHSGFLKRGEF